MGVFQRSRIVQLIWAGCFGFFAAGPLLAGPPKLKELPDVDPKLKELLPDARPVPWVQVIPLPEAQASFRWGATS